MSPCMIKEGAMSPCGYWGKGLETVKPEREVNYTKPTGYREVYIRGGSALSKHDIYMFHMRR